MNANPPANSPPAKQTSTQLSPGLKSLLELEPSDDRAVREIAECFREEAKAALPALRAAATQPAGEDGVKRVVGPRFALFTQPERTPQEWGAWWSDYFAALEDLPEGALEAGMQAWVRKIDSEYMPKPGQLRELALKTPNRLGRAYERAMAGVHYRPAQRYVPEPAEKVELRTRDQADKAEVAKLMAEFKSEMAARQPPPAPKRTFPPPLTDERGITPQMRALLERQE